MKRRIAIALRLSGLLSFAPLYLAPAATAQSPPSPISGAPTLTPSSTPEAVVTPPPAPKKVLSLRISAGTVGSAVDELQGAAKAAHVPEVNVVYGPGAAGVPVPELTIRNVSAPDGLYLIATSAGCKAEPISGAQQGEIIGYRIAQPAGASLPGTLQGFGGGGFRSGGVNAGPVPATSSAPGPSGKPGRGQTPNHPSADSPNEFARGFGVAPSPEDPLDNLRNDARIVTMGLNPHGQGPSVRVYPLGNITSNVKFPDVEATLQEVLKADGGTTDSTKLAVHEKTNVLVVTGPASCT
jgi:hypothetical protein